MPRSKKSIRCEEASNTEYVVYCATSPSGKKYVGITKNIKERIYLHLYEARTKRRNYPLHKSIRKYGQESLQWEVLGTSMSWEATQNLEKFYIKKLNTLSPFGYNLTEGGEGSQGMKMSEESRRKLSISKKGTRHTDEAKRKVSIANIGKIVSLETRRRMSESNKGQKPSELAKEMAARLKRVPVACFDSESNLVASFISVKSAVIWLGGISSAKNEITDCCKGKRANARGYTWKYKEVVND